MFVFLFANLYAFANSNPGIDLDYNPCDGLGSNPGSDLDYNP